MNIDKTLGGVQSITRTVETGVNTVTRAAADFGLSPLSDGGGVYWKDRLRPAKYRGIPFGVLSSTQQFGRRNAVHQYPFRDKCWVEDLGKGVRRISINGFLVESAAYGGLQSVIAQREKMIAAAETEGDGELVHPTLGRMTVSMVGPMVVEERWDNGRVFEISFSFIEAGARIFPSVETSTGDAVNSACDAANAAASGDFSSSVSGIIKKGTAVVSQAANTAAEWGRKAQKLANDATNLYNMVGTLKGSYGRYFGGRTSGLGGKASALSSKANSVSGLIALGSAARGKVSTAISSLTSIASGLGS